MARGSPSARTHVKEWVPPSATKTRLSAVSKMKQGASGELVYAA